MVSVPVLRRAIFKDGEEEGKQVTTETIFNSTCKICERVAFGPIVPLGLEQWRHAHCAIGSQEWKAYYHRLPKAEQALLTEFYHFFYGRASS